MNTPVKFETAKLLNNKGLPGLKSFYDNQKHYKLNPKKYTIAEVVMWLYEKHGIWIEVRKSYLSGFVPVIKEPRVELDRYKSPTEAYETAIEYTLNNLI